MRTRAVIAGIVLSTALALATIPGASPASAKAWPGHPDRTLVSYHVRSGDTLYGLAVRYHAWTKELASLNHLTTVSTLQVGQRLVIPVVTSRATKTSRATPRASAKSRAIAAINARYAYKNATRWPGHPDRIVIKRVVKPGQTIYRLAVRYHAWTAEIASLNGISYTVRGQRVKIPIVVSAMRKARDAEIARVTAKGHPRKTYAQRMAAAGWRNYAMTRSQVRRAIVQTARRHGVNPTLALAVAWQESGWHQPLTSSAGALGVMQVMPSTAAWMSAYAGRRLNPRGTRDNIQAGVLFLRYLSRLAGPSHRGQIIAGYYQGMTAIGRHPRWYTDTKQYVRSVSAIYRSISAGRM